MKYIARVDRINADRTSYKQYNPNFLFQDLYVEFEVPNEEIRKEAACPETPDILINIVSLKGFTLLLDAVASTADAANQIYMKRLQKGA